VLYTWVFNGLFQLARYPFHVSGWLLLSHLIIPVGIITTFPVQALTGNSHEKIFYWIRSGDRVGDNARAFS
jgi:ABC-type uncharacterized transport system permease subunit